MKLLSELELVNRIAVKTFRQSQQVFQFEISSKKSSTLNKKTSFIQTSIVNKGKIF